MKIGRAPESDVVIDDKCVSRHQCLITCTEARDGDFIHLIDLSSRGTYLNGRKVGKGERRQLADKDII